MTMRSRRRGFTLIELLIVIVIIGVLAAITLVRYWAVRERAHLTAVQSDLRQVATYQELYHEKNLQYASTVADLAQFDPSPGVTVTLTAATATGWAATATHAVINPRQCGLFYGDAAAADAPPAQYLGAVACN